MSILKKPLMERSAALATSLLASMDDSAYSRLKNGLSDLHISLSENNEVSL